MPETGFCYVNLVVLHLRASESSCSKDNKTSEGWWWQGTLSFPFFLPLEPPKGTFRRVWLSRKKGNIKWLWSRKQNMTQGSNCLATRAWKSSSSRLPAPPSHPARTLGLETLDRALLFVWIPIRVQVTDPWRTLGLRAQLSFASSVPHPQPLSFPPGW